MKKGQHDARQLLAPVYERFTEGFETPDLRCASDASITAAWSRWPQQVAPAIDKLHLRLTTGAGVGFDKKPLELAAKKVK
jgi:hypothetical protein